MKILNMSKKEIAMVVGAVGILTLLFVFSSPPNDPPKATNSHDTDELAPLPVVEKATYYNPEFGFSFEYPSNFEVDEEYVENCILGCHPFLSISSPQYSTSISLEVFYPGLVLSNTDKTFETKKGTLVYRTADSNLITEEIYNSLSLLEPLAIGQREAITLNIEDLFLPITSNGNYKKEVHISTPEKDFLTLRIPSVMKEETPKWLMQDRVYISTFTYTQPPLENIYYDRDITLSTEITFFVQKFDPIDGVDFCSRVGSDCYQLLTKDRIYDRENLPFGYHLRPETRFAIDTAYVILDDQYMMEMRVSTSDLDSHYMTMLLFDEINMFDREILDNVLDTITLIKE